jgi:hypothetical protein
VSREVNHVFCSRTLLLCVHVQSSRLRDPCLMTWAVLAQCDWEAVLRECQMSCHQMDTSLCSPMARV